MAITETERARASGEFGQGDIIQIEYPAREGGGPSLGVIINADCDLAHGKTDGVIAFLPIYTFQDYLNSFWAPGHVQEVARTATSKILQIVGDREDSAENLREMVRSSPEDEVVTVLCTQAKVKKKDVPSLKEQVRRLAVAINDEITPLERFSQLCHHDQDPQRYARKQVVDARRSMGEGHFFISEIIDRDEVGFVIRMRRIWTLPVELCFTSTAVQRARSGGEGATAVRIAQLTPLYRFRLLQLFAQQYSRIGLPDDVTALSELAVDDLVHILTGTMA